MTRPEGAVAIGKPTLVIAPARCQAVLLRDALGAGPVLTTAAPDNFPAAAARLGARLIPERRVSVAEAQLAFAVLQTLAGPEREGRTLSAGRLQDALVLESSPRARIGSFGVSRRCLR